MKYQDLFSLKNYFYFKMLSATVVIGALRVKDVLVNFYIHVRLSS